MQFELKDVLALFAIVSAISTPMVTLLVLRSQMSDIKETLREIKFAVFGPAGHENRLTRLETVVRVREECREECR